MFTTEQKLDLVMGYIAATDDTQRSEFKKRIIVAMKDGTSAAPCKPASIDDLIIDFFKEVGVPAALKGHDIAVCAIKLAISDRSYINAMTSRLYPDVAAECGTTPSRAERAMRHAIEAAFDRCDFEIHAGIFGNSIGFKNGKLTNREFVAACANEVSRRMKIFNIEVA